MKAGFERARFEDLCGAAARGQVRFTWFLEPPAIPEARRAARQAGVCVSFEGGYEGAERVIAAFYDAETPERWPIECLRLEWNAAYASVGHRDILGAILAQGIDRAAVGDIVPGEDCALVFAHSAVAESLAASLQSAGRAKLSVRLSEGEAPPQEAGEPLRRTVSSMRLDAVVAAGHAIGRAQARELIQRGLVKLNHLPEQRADARIRAGDLISLRGYGRLRVDEEQGSTKKGRMGVRMTRFGGK